MNTLVAVIIGALTVYLAYTLYARRTDRQVIQSAPKRATPATLFMDGVDFMPTNRNILFGYHFKSIAAAGPIVGAIVAATLWGWLTGSSRREHERSSSCSSSSTSCWWPGPLSASWPP